MGFRDILAIVTSQAANEHVIAFAVQLASQNEGRVRAALVNWEPNVAPVDGFVMDPLYGQLLNDARKQLEEETKKLEARLGQDETPSSVEPYMIEFAAAGAALGMRARHSDVSVVAAPTKSGLSSAMAVLEAALFDSGRPVFVVPSSWKPRHIGKAVLVAWKPTREAARAIGDAEAFLANADKVGVATVDATPSRDYGEQPGADITAHLAYRGAKAQLFNLDSGGRTETQALLDQAMALGADLIVMGGYGRSRMSEMIFGGVTREILKSTNIPVLMSH